MRRKTTKTCKTGLEKSLERLIKQTQNIEDPCEKQAFVTFCIANLVSKNYDEIEALGLLEKVKSLIGELNKPTKPSCQFSKLSYIS